MRVGKSKADIWTACWYLQVGRSTVMALIDSGDIRVKRMRVGGIRVLRDSIDRYMGDDSEREDAAYLEVAGRAGL